ncbi:hypothetical protein B0H14DRAFT_3865360 [Mycena olivaceomarginata]|nr:hypothetical protein B0H14DRAFT_3865360 [Mycena olivaceomarginata]
MFGESDSESPRVSSPWDSILSTPPSPSPSPLAAAIPKLVPEQDDGNVEYKLQLLSPSPARFARLVTQMKWRLLEGGGQAYYELGVADSGILVGLPRAELEQSLETLDAMAGEIGASVIVVKEIEVPAAMAGLVATQTDTWNGKRARRRQALMTASEESTSADDSTATNTETEPEMSATDVDDDADDLSATVLLDPPKYRGGGGDVFSMEVDDVDSSADSSDADADAPPPQPHPRVPSLDLEIASVFKPRPVRPKAPSAAPPPLPAKTKRGSKSRKGPHLPAALAPPAAKPKPTKSENRRQARDRKREERRAALMVYATAALAPQDAAACAVPDTTPGPDAEPLVPGLEALHVSVEPLPLPVAVAAALPSPAEPAIPARELPPVSVSVSEDDGDGDDDVFPSPLTATPGSFTAFASQLTAPVEHSARGAAQGAAPRLIVEALVVRKMSLEEAFLDFGGFALID